MSTLQALLSQVRPAGGTGSVGSNHVRGLIAALRAEGVEPTDAAAYDRLVAVQPPTPALPERLLGLNPEEYAEQTIDTAIRRQARGSISEAFFSGSNRLATEMAASMLAEVDDYLAHLASRFDEAAEHAHDLVRLGVKATDEPGDLLRRSPDVVSAYLLFVDKHAPVLDRIAAARVQLGFVLRIEPGVWIDDLGMAFMSPLVPGLFRPRRGYRDEWRRWIAIAERAELRLLSRAEVRAAAAEVERQALVTEDEDGRLVNTV